MLAAESQLLFVTMPAELDRGIKALVRERHAHTPTIWAVTAPMPVNEIVERNSQWGLQRCLGSDSIPPPLGEVDRQWQRQWLGRMT